MIFSSVIRSVLNRPAWKVAEIINDEASQVPLFFTVALSYLFPSMKKLVLVGDPAQLAPYGTEEGLPQILSTFDLVARKVPSIFLDINRRVPLPIAGIVSQISYEGKLHTHVSKDIPSRECLKWLDVHGSEMKDGTSKTNMKEVDAIVRLLLSFDEDVLNNLTVLTLYKKQSSVLAARIKRESINVNVVTVDSFQGREDETIVFSLVSTHGIGFAKDKRRVNVALTRVKTRMYLVGDLDFWQTQDLVRPLAQLAKIADIVQLDWYVDLVPSI